MRFGWNDGAIHRYSAGSCGEYLNRGGWYETPINSDDNTIEMKGRPVQGRSFDIEKRQLLSGCLFRVLRKRTAC